MEGAPGGAGAAETRLVRLELAMLELVTALGMLVSELAGRDDLALSTADEVERALEHGWSTLTDDAFRSVEPAHAPRAGPPYLYEVGRELAAVARSDRWAGGALRRAMDASGAAVGAVYEISDRRDHLTLVASEGYPDEVMEHFRVVPLDAVLPVAVVARTGRPLWFRERGEILEQYPHLQTAHEQTERAIGAPGVQGAVVPLAAEGSVSGVLLVGFTSRGDVESAGRRAAKSILENGEPAP
jgi:GAF domain